MVNEYKILLFLVLLFWGVTLWGNDDGQSHLNRARVFLDRALGAESEEEMQYACSKCAECINYAEPFIKPETEEHIVLSKLSARLCLYQGRESDAHNHLNDLLKSSLAVYGKDSRQYGRSLLWCASLCVEAGDFAQAQHILSITDTFFRDRFDGGFQGRDTLSQIMMLEAQIRLYEKDAETLALRKQVELTNLLKRYYGEQSDEYLNALLDLAEDYALLRYSRASFKALADARDVMKYKLDFEFGRLTENERAKYWKRNSAFFYKFADLAYEMANRVVGNNDINKLAYNSVLLSKGILLDTVVDYDNFVLSVSDTLANRLLEDKKSRLFRNESLLSVDSSDQVLVNYMNSNGYIYRNPDFDIKWSDVANALKDDDIAIEFLKTSKGEYAVMFVRKEWSAPRCIRLKELVKVGGKYKPLASMLPYAPSSNVNTEVEDVLAEIVWPKSLLRFFPKTLEGKVYFSTSAELDVTPIEYLADMHERYSMCRLSSTRLLAKHDERNVEAISRVGMYGGVDFDVPPVVRREAVGKLESLTSNRDSAIVLRDTKYESVWSSSSSITRAAIEVLPGSIEEVVSISESLTRDGIKNDLFTGCYATEESLLKMAHLQNVIHVATHGFSFPAFTSASIPYIGETVDYSDPLIRNGLKMAGCSNNKEIQGLSDGYLTAKEISQQNMSSTRLVVLSACNSGQGDIGADGVYGLQRAFKMSGVEALLTTLWEVDDAATNMMMQRFYDYWDMTNPKASIHDAFNRALLDLKQSYPHPYYWAPFILLDAF